MNGAVNSLIVSVLFPKKLSFTDIKSSCFIKGLFFEPFFALEEYEIFLFKTDPSSLYLIKTIFPDSGFIGPVKLIASDNEASSGNFTVPGFSTLPKISTVMNLGERPLKTDLGICSEEVLFNFGRKILSPSNIRMSLLSSY